MKLTVLAIAAAVTVAFRASAQQQDFSKVEIKTVDVAPGVHMLIGSGGNIGVSSGPDGVLIIDDQYAPLTDKIRAAVSAISKDKIRFVVNTHWHGDHTGGNENMGGAGRSSSRTRTSGGGCRPSRSALSSNAPLPRPPRRLSR